jgi:hypothetical protein
VKVNVFDVNMPVLVRSARLLEAVSARRRPFPDVPPQQILFLQNAVNTGRRDGDNVRVEHSVRHQTITVVAVDLREIDDRLALPAEQPMALRDLPVVTIRLPATASPVVILRIRDANRRDQFARRFTRQLSERGDKSDNFIADVQIDPRAVQASPSVFFFNLTVSFKR